MTQWDEVLKVQNITDCKFVACERRRQRKTLERYLKMNACAILSSFLLFILLYTVGEIYQTWTGERGWSKYKGFRLLLLLFWSSHFLQTTLFMSLFFRGRYRTVLKSALLVRHAVQNSQSDSSFEALSLPSLIQKLSNIITPRIN